MRDRERDLLGPTLDTTTVQNHGIFHGCTAGVFECVLLSVSLSLLSLSLSVQGPSCAPLAKPWTFKAQKPTLNPKLP